MDLGFLKFRCQGVNLLAGAIHDEHGVAWTDGLGIYLSQVSLYRGQLENQEHCKLGEFDRGVKSIHWSDSISDELCYMCVVHERNISIWKVEGRQPKLAFKQIRKINIQPVPQGCNWNPGRDILCALCPQQASLYYSHLQNKGSQVLVQLEKDKIRCGCWTSDGSKLIICAGTTLMVFFWSDIDSAVTQYTALRWTIPGLSGCVSSIAAISSDRVILAAELPLESLCKNQDSFVLPDLLNSDLNGPVTDQITDADIIRPKGEQISFTDSLLNLQRNPNTEIQDCCRLVVLRLREERSPVKVATADVKGVLSPDLLLYQASQNQVLIGSNTQTLLQVFSLQKDQIVQTLEIALDKDERPVGVADLPRVCRLGDTTHGVLVLIGKKDNSDTAFLPSSPTVTMKSVLKFFNLKHAKFEKNPLTHTMSAPSIPVSVATNGHQDPKDYDSIYESVLNFDTNLKKSSRKIANMENKENNNSKMSDIITGENSGESLVESVLREIPKTNGFQISGNNGGSGEKVTEVSSPPKRPVRKKKSLRQNKDDVLRHSSLGLVSIPQNESKTKMPMEYLSDSSEPSPRGLDDTGTGESSSNSSPDMPIRQIDKNIVSSEQSRNGYLGESEKSGGLIGELEKDTSVRDHVMITRTSDRNELKVDHVRRDIGLSSGDDGWSTDAKRDKTDETKMLERNSSQNCQGFEGQSEQYHVSLELNSENEKRGKVEVIGDDDPAVEELEVAKTDFQSQERNFKAADFHHMCSEESKNQAFVENYLSEKLNAKNFVNATCELNNAVKNEDDNGLFPRSGVPGITELLEDATARKPGPMGAKKLSTSLESLEDIDKLLKEQNEKIAKLQEQMNKLSRRVDEASCVLPTRYQSASKPDTVQVCFWCKDGFKIEKKFLLDNGRLQLEQIKQAFSLETVEIFIDNEACVVGSNIDGYIPVRFEPGSSISIGGKPALS